MVSATFSRSASARLTPRSVGPSPRIPAAGGHRRWPPSFNVLAVGFCLGSVVLVIGCVVYLYAFRYFGRGDLAAEFSGMADEETCDVFAGRWVRDDTYPLYNSSKCPFVERGFNYLANGREDMDYLRWRWKPKHCDVPRFDARGVLESLRGKWVVFVGDSMSRTQWESFICMLMTGVEDPESVSEVNGNTITKTIRYLGVQFKSFNLTVEFFRSVFIMQQVLPPKHGPRRVRMVLKLDKMDDINHNWADSDVLIFNSGHWWTPAKLFDV